MLISIRSAMPSDGPGIAAVQLATSFLTRARIGPCVAEGRVLRAGRTLVFTEAKLWSADGTFAAHATATLARSIGTSATG